jgi:phosphoribosylformimino-5-aminoimidazole carboxamide ribotide isomerase
MDLYFAIDLKSGSVVHGKSGMRDQYLPVRSMHADTHDPLGFIEQIKPKFLYIADLDRICGTGNHDTLIPEIAARTERVLIDRGCRKPGDILHLPLVADIIGTETAGDALEYFSKGVLSVDIKDGVVIPWRIDPGDFLRSGINRFETVIILDIGGVGTKNGLKRDLLTSYRAAYNGILLWGGGVADINDLLLLEEAGYNGAIIATAVHTGVIPIELIRKGTLCL